MKGQELWTRAKKIIPGGNQLLSKRPERFLPGNWPAYYSKAKGCEIWDLDGNHYFDFAQMGVGSCILGYSDDDVNKAVASAIDKASMATLNCFEEIELAEKLIDLHSWADMARFARTGGEACAIAIRIARAATGRDKIAFCGYHGWSDWYLSANIGASSNLDGMLLPGLDTAGVPRELMHTALPFNYNKLIELEAIFDKYPGEIGTVIMEPRRENGPGEGFLEEVQRLARKHNAVLIFDEVTSGFRENVGGIHLKYGVLPDIAIFGKGLGNGFPISAIIGKKNIMDAAQKSFISSTMWTERIGFVAAIATIEKMITKSVPAKLVQYGKQINDGWNKLATTHDIPIRISGIPPLTHISFETNDPLAFQTFYTQEMLKKGYLLGASVYTTYAYNADIIHGFIQDSDEVFHDLRKALAAGNIRELLDDEVIHAGFRRLT